MTVVPIKSQNLNAVEISWFSALDLPNYPDADYKELETPASRKKLSWKPKNKKEE